MTAVNDPPVVEWPSSQTFVENTTLTFSTGNDNVLSVGDPDAGTAPIQLALNASGGKLTLSQTTGLTFTIGTGTGEAIMLFTGTIANINLALQGMTFTPTQNLVGNGAGSIQLTANDLGNTGTGGATWR